MRAILRAMSVVAPLLGLTATACTSALGVSDLPSDTCGGTTGTTECEVCLYAQCCPDVVACAEDSQCGGSGELYDCALDCNGDQGCLNNCGSSYPASVVSEANALLACGTQCDSACGGGGSGSGSGGGSSSGGTTSCRLDWKTTGCASCMSASCCSYETTCSDDASCVTLLDCLVNCSSGDTTCENNCTAAAPGTAYSELSDMLTCSTNSCSSSSACGS